jgi:hypothetical protein
MLTRQDRIRWRNAALLGAFLALIPYLWLINAGRVDLFAEKPLGDFYDAQAHSLLDGRLDVPEEVLKVEAFENDGKTYMYFGPVPAILRMPVAAVTDDLDGRLTQTSMTVGVIVAMFFGSRLHKRLRIMMKGRDRFTRIELIGAGAFTFAIGAGSSLLYVANTPIVYHEAITWGVAISLAAYERLLAWRDEPTTGRLLGLVAIITIALLTRSSVGGGPLAAFAMYCGLDLVRRRLSVQQILRLGLAILLPVVVYSGVNYAKFDSLFSVPFQTQGINDLRADRADVLDANDGTIFGVRFLPSTTLQFVRPDALDVSREFPYLDFPELATVIGDVTFDDIERSSSVPNTMPVWTVLGVVGIIAIARDRRLWRLAVPIIGATAGVLVTLTIGYIGQRYTADALPLLVLAGSVGLHHLTVPSRVRWLPAFGALLAVTVFVVLALGLRYQREWGFLIDEDVRAELVRFQHGDAPALGALPDPPIGNELPGVITAPGSLFVINDCAAVYFAKDRTWEPVERMPEGGRFVMDVTLPGSFDAAEVVSTIVVAPAPAQDGERAFTVAHADQVSDPITYDPGEPISFDAVVDWRIGFVTVAVDGEAVIDPFYDGPRTDAVVNPDFPGTIDLADREPTACRAVIGDGS